MMTSATKSNEAIQRLASTKDGLSTIKDKVLNTLPDEGRALACLKTELERVVIKVNYHFQSGYERHVNLQSPESILLNFLKKEIKEIAPQYIYRLSKKDFVLTMSEGYVINLTFHPYSDKHDWRSLDERLSLLSKAAQLLDFEALKKDSHTLDKFYQLSTKSISEIKNFSFK